MKGLQKARDRLLTGPIEMKKMEKSDERIAHRVAMGPRESRGEEGNPRKRKDMKWLDKKQKERTKEKRQKVQAVWADIDANS